MRIALLHWAFPPVVGGVETHLFDYVSELLSRGHEVTVFSGTQHPTPVSGEWHVYVPDLDPLVLPNPMDLRAYLTQIVTEYHIEVLHAHNMHMYFYEAAHAAASLAAMPGLRTVHTWHSVGHHDRLFADWDVKLSVSEYLAKTLSPKIETTPLHLGIDLSRFTSIPLEPLPSERPIILLPGRLVPEKGARTAIQMLPHLRKYGIDAELWLTEPLNTMDVFTSPAQFEGELWSFAQELEVDDAIKFVPAQLSEMPLLYGAASVVICPSEFEEPLGLAAIEAMASGRPTFVAPRGGLPETGSPLVTSAEHLAMRIEQVLMDHEYRAALCPSLRNCATAAFDITTYTDKMLSLYAG